MNREQNLYVLAQLRRDLALIGADVPVPCTMTEEEKEEAYGDLIKTRQVRRLIHFDTGSRQDLTPKQRKAIEEAIKASGEEATISYPPPPSVQIYGASVNVNTSGAHVTRAINGPCMLDHILAYTPLYVAGVNAPIEWALHVSSSPNVGPFQGDMTIFRIEDPANLIAPLNPYGIQIYKDRYETLVGWRPWRTWEMFPRIPIPFTTFYLNLTVGKTNHPAALYCLVDFGSIEVPRGARLAATVVTPRIRAIPEAYGEEKAEPAIAKREFASYAQVKEYQALGNTIVWATMRNTGRRDYPLEVSVVEKVPMALPPNTP